MIYSKRIPNHKRVMNISFGMNIRIVHLARMWPVNPLQEVCVVCVEDKKVEFICGRVAQFHTSSMWAYMLEEKTTYSCERHIYGPLAHPATVFGFGLQGHVDVRRDLVRSCSA